MPDTDPSSDVLDQLRWLETNERHYALTDMHVTAAHFAKVKATIERLSAELARLRLLVRAYVDPAEVKADLLPLVEEINAEFAALSDTKAG